MLASQASIASGPELSVPALDAHRVPEVVAAGRASPIAAQTTRSPA